MSALINKDDIPMVVQVECKTCAYLKEAKTCLAFPNGIPNPIWTREVDHLTPYKGDNGITYNFKGVENL